MHFKITALLLAFAFLCASSLGFQAGQTTSQPSIEEVIRRFTEAETQNKIALNNYIFVQDVDIMTIGEAGSITGRMRRTSDIIYDDRHNRIERITFFPPSTLTEISLTQEDMQDLAGVQPFALTVEDLPKYQIDYLGKEKIDELDTYVFDVKPKKIVKGERYLQGKIFVDDHDLQIVKVAGQAVPEVGNQKFPHFESYRENIDSRYWFPTYVSSDDVLEFKKGPSVHLRVLVRYTNYKKFSGRVRLADEGEAATDDDLKSADKNKTPKPPDKTPVKPPGR